VEQIVRFTLRMVVGLPDRVVPGGKVGHLEEVVAGEPSLIDHPPVIWLAQRLTNALAEGGLEHLGADQGSWLLWAIAEEAQAATAT
jgi:hypothetical protein